MTTCSSGGLDLLGSAIVGNVGAALTKFVAPFVLIAWGWQAVAQVWAVAPVDGGWQVELAGRHWPGDWEVLASELLGCEVRESDNLALHDRAAGLYRLAIFAGDRLQAALFVSRRPVTIGRQGAVAQLGAAFTPATRSQIVSGRGSCPWPLRRPNPVRLRECRSWRDRRGASVRRAHRQRGRCGDTGRHRLRLMPHRNQGDDRSHAAPGRRVRPRQARIAPLAVLPVFLRLAGRRAVAFGASAAATWKAELLAAAGAQVHVFAPANECSDEIRLLLSRGASSGALRYHDAPWRPENVAGAGVVVVDARSAAEPAAMRDAAAGLQLMPSACGARSCASALAIHG